MYSVCLVFGCINIIYCRIFGVQRGIVLLSFPRNTAKRGLAFQLVSIPDMLSGLNNSGDHSNEGKYHDTIRAW